jgi:hypothetical protein
MAIKILDTQIEQVFIIDFQNSTKCEKDKTSPELVTFLTSKLQNVLLYKTEEKNDFIAALLDIIGKSKGKSILLYLIGHGNSTCIGNKLAPSGTWSIKWDELLPYLRDINYSTGNKLFLNTMFVCGSGGMLEDEVYSTDCFRFFLGNCPKTEGVGEVVRHNADIFPSYNNLDTLRTLERRSQFIFSIDGNPKSFCMTIRDNKAPLLDGRDPCDNEEVLQILDAKEEAGLHTDSRVKTYLKQAGPTFKLTLRCKDDFLGLIFHEINESRLLTQGGRRSLKDVIARMQKNHWNLNSLVSDLGLDRERQHSPEWFASCLDIYDNFDMGLFSPLFLQDANKDEQAQTLGSGYYLLDGTHRSLVLAWKLIVDNFPYTAIDAYVFRPRQL